MKRILWALALVACGKGVPIDTDTDTDPTGGDTDVPPIDTAPEWPLWVYESYLAPKTAQFAAGGAPLVQVDGFAWGGSFGGPAIISELDHEVLASVRNETALELAFEFDGVEVIDELVLPPGGVSDAVTYRTTQGPGVHLYRVPSDGDALARRGLFGVVSVRDPAAFPLEEIDRQADLAIVDLPVDFTEVDGCRTGEVTDAPCPAWIPADAPWTVAVAHQILLNPLQQQRHGGPPNEFLTSTVGSFYWKTGDDVRIHVASLSDAPHTLSLGGLTFTDASGVERDQIVLEPGQAGFVLLQEVGPVGVYEVRCLDHDHQGLDRVEIYVEA